MEPLFSLRFGFDPLAEIVGMISEAQQSVELHLHTEWVDKAKKNPLSKLEQKKQHLRYFDLEDQKELIKIGKKLLLDCGVDGVNAFRAGNFGFNLNTLDALEANKIKVDSSYNATIMGRDSGLMPGSILVEPLKYNNVFESPMTVYYDRPNHLRHMQICACSFSEMEHILWQSLESNRQEVSILLHNFELLDRKNIKPDMIVLRRFVKLCKFLKKNEDCFNVKGFSDYTCQDKIIQPEPLHSPLRKTFYRYLEQAWSRLI